MKRLLICLSLCLFIVSPAFALGIETPLPDAAQEARAKALFHDIRCVVCQSESVADSPAEIAGDIRRIIRDEVGSGASDDAIRAKLVQHYGDFILMKPPLKNATYLLWFGPALVLACATLLAARYFRKHRKNVP